MRGRPLTSLFIGTGKRRATILLSCFNINRSADTALRIFYDGCKSVFEYKFCANIFHFTAVELVRLSTLIAVNVRFHGRFLCGKK